MTIGNDLLNLFYPRLCLLCKNALIENEEQLCLHCLCDFPRTNYHRREDNPLLALFAGFSSLQDITAFMFYEKGGTVQQLIHAFKYQENEKLAKILGRIAALELKSDGLFRDVEVFVPVPLHKRKERKRGYNQSEWIARGFASVYHCPVDCKTLRRSVDTETQTHKSAYERHVNMEHVFELRNPESLEGKHVLLIDDVLTTGSTLLACVNKLIQIPRIRIGIFALTVAI